ncbi:MAG: hypothetical protein AVDCRST_MAG11-3918 [uncultured Gemmatimonadaceae bacterium]|uniref:Uncharacterized protein n=1 Tax=uncultured Gemmatimonadaceae bacterium TaxID=246130 RepID=A0A6J4MFC0_9BACT|nr:MAG: hypothetical protein AVDCRST_MAG11-3918 [uncultured Gemmatimonadaceae bacterium]
MVALRSHPLRQLPLEHGDRRVVTADVDVHHRGEQPALAAEDRVDGVDGDARVLGHGRQGGGGVAVGQEAPVPRLHDRSPGLTGLLPADR